MKNRYLVIGIIVIAIVVIFSLFFYAVPEGEGAFYFGTNESKSNRSGSSILVNSGSSCEQIYDAFAEEKENARYCTTDNECNYTNTIRKGPSQLWCCGIVYSERQGLEGLKEIGELYNSKSCPETKAACDCQDFKYGEFKCIENKCAYVSNFDRPRMKDLWNKCGNGICESEESGYGCDPVFDASECDNHVYCPQDCSS